MGSYSPESLMDPQIIFMATPAFHLTPKPVFSPVLSTSTCLLAQNLTLSLCYITFATLSSLKTGAYSLAPLFLIRTTANQYSKTCLYDSASLYHLPTKIKGG